MIIEIPLRTVSGMNAREHWRVRAKRVKAEREVVRLFMSHRIFPLPCVVTMTRIGPTNGLDDDNLASSMKAVRDQIAASLGIDDRHADIVRYVCKQERGPKWLVRVTIEEAA